MIDLKQIIDPQSTVLLVIDMQNDFCHPEGVCALSVSDVTSTVVMLPSLIKLIDNARRANVKIILIRTTYDEWTVSNTMKLLPRYEEWSNKLCLAGTWGVEFFGVSPKPEDYVITKHRNSAFIGTSLDLVLRSIGVKTIIVTGVSTHICVECTIRDGFQYGYFPILASDCTETGSSDERVLRSAFERIDGRWGKVVTSEEIAKAWGLT